MEMKKQLSKNYKVCSMHYFYMLQLVAKYIDIRSERVFLLFLSNISYKNIPAGETSSEQIYRAMSKYSVF